MADWTIPEGYEFAFYFALILLGVKVALASSYGIRIKIERRNDEKVPMALFYGIFLEIVMLFIGRLIFFWFDFVLTRFDASLYGNYPNILFWKFGNFTQGIGIVALIFAFEHTAFLKRTRYIFTIWSIIPGIFQLMYPVMPGNAESFAAMENLTYFGLPPLILLYSVLLWLGIVSPGLRKLAWIAVIGSVVYFLGGILLGMSVVTGLSFAIQPSIIFALGTSLKIIGLSSFFYLGINFRRLNKAIVNYYSSRKICIVHRGKIQGTPFMCATCGVLYCNKCKEAVVRAENKCWNCKAMIDTSTQISFQVRADDAMFQKFANFKDGLNKETDLDAFRTLLELGDLIIERRNDQSLGEIANAVEEIITKQPRDEINAMIKDNIAELEIPVTERESSPKKVKIDKKLLIESKKQ